MEKWYNYPRFAAEQRCRFCDHPAKFHMQTRGFSTSGRINLPYEAKWDQCYRCERDIVTEFICPGFAPKDNLEYLEMKSE